MIPPGLTGSCFCVIFLSSHLTNGKTMEQSPQSEEFVNTELAAKMLGLTTRQAIAWLIKNRGLKAEKVGGRYILRRADVEAYRQKRERK